MNIFKSKISNSAAVTYQLLDQLHVKVNKSTLSVNLESHPEFSSLLAISDCLTDLNVDNLIYKVDVKSYDQSDLSFPFITHFSRGRGKFLLVRGIYNHVFSLSDERNKDLRLSEKEFLASWDGIILHAKSNEKSGEKNFYQNKIQISLQQATIPAFLITLLSVFVFLFNLNTFHWSALLLCLIKLLGVTIGIFLLMQSINANHALIRSLCNVTGKNDCNAILNSKAAKLTSWLSWSEVGFFYFSGSFLAALIFPISLPALSWINLLALPYTVYSISYQYRMKNWCVLCCVVQVLLITEAIIFSLRPDSWSFSSFFPSNLLIPFFLCFLLPILTWALLKPFFLKAFKIAIVQQQLKYIKYNNHVFMSFLTNQTYYKVDNEMMPIIIGNSNAETVITVVSNLFCSPCADAHHFLDQLLKQRDELQLKIIFFNGNKHDNSHKNIVQHIMALSVLEDRSVVQEALNDWYSQHDKKQESWIENYPIKITEAVETAFIKQKIWCEMAEITFTPTILVNGYKLPEPYRLEDLKYLIN